MGNLAHVYDDKRELMKEIYHLANLRVQLTDSKDGGVFVLSVSQSSLIVEIEEKKALDPNSMKIKSNMGQHKVADFVIGGDGILRYQGRLCSLDVDEMRERVLAEAHGSHYAIHPDSTKIYHNLRKFY